jgi:2-C-methyl-D-erythritol 4-phosphate cytidylyltransferase
LIRSLILAAARCGACIPVIPVAETVKCVNGRDVVVSSPNRDFLRLAQTPQAFILGVIRQAHFAAQDKGITATDDAALVEADGGRVQTIQGCRFNMKITTAEDLALARAILAAGLWPPSVSSAKQQR